MTRYNYNSQVNPPAPFVLVTIRTADRIQEIADIPAQLDTAADRTVVPRVLLDQLGSHVIRQLPAAGLGGNLTLLSTFWVEIEVHQLHPLTIEVLSHDDEQFILVGRDILNHFRVLLDGPNRMLEIG
jgi:hypothetical protein